MDTDQIIKMLPPIVLGIGGILPMIIVSSPSVFVEAPKALLCTVMILVVWTGYLGSFMCWQRLLFDDRITLAFLVVGLVCLMWVVLGSFRSKDVSNSSDHAAASRIQRLWKWLLRMARPTPDRSPTAYFAAYFMALLAVSIAAALYVAPQNQVVVKIDIPLAVDAVEVIRDNADPLRIWHKQGPDGIKIVLSRDEFASSKTFVIHTDARTIWTAERSAARPTINPALGERYIIAAYASKRIP
jgi:hypothetical protein